MSPSAQRRRRRAAPGRRSCGRASSCRRRSGRSRRRCRRAGARRPGPRSGAGRRSPSLSAVGLDDDVAEPRARRGCGSRRWSSCALASSAQQLLVALRGGPCSWPGGPSATCGPTRARAASARRRADSCFSSLREPRLLLLEPAGVVALVRDALAAVELEDPAGHVVEEVAVVGDGDDGARGTRPGGARARRPTRRRGGSWARRAAAGRARAGAAGRAPRGAARRRRAWSTSASPGGRRRASMAVSSMRVEVPAVDRVDLAPAPRPSRRAALHLVGVERLAELRRDRVEAVEQGARLARRPPRRCRGRPWSGRAAGSCARKPTVAPGASRASPPKRVSTPAMIRRSVLLPEPFAPEDADLGAVEERQRDAFEDDLVGRVVLHQAVQREDDLFAHRRAG